MESINKNYFTELNSINLNDVKEQKNKLDYISWAWAWGKVKEKHPDTTSKVYETENGMLYWTDGRTCWVKVGVTINGIEHIEYLPIMDYKNQSIPLEKVTSMDMNKSIQRALTKAIARHGLGLYVYAGEDLPEGCEDTPKVEPPKAEPPKRITEVADKNSVLASKVEFFKTALHGTVEKVLIAKKIDDINTMTVEQWDEIIELQRAGIEKARAKQQGANNG